MSSTKQEMNCNDYKEALLANPGFEDESGHLESCASCQALTTEVAVREKQIKAASQRTDVGEVINLVERLVSMTDGCHPQGQALSEAAACLIKCGRVVELSSLLRLQREHLGRRPDRPLEGVGLVSALAAMPQAAGIQAEDGAALVDAAVPLLALPAGGGGVSPDEVASEGP